ncbi:hypothetical protein BW716_11725 [[Flexibacter] sp. ATCC 35208]|nr:hypothetical protein BW716_11725 [[Flexibacter] sp. ATCC 35208]
MKEGIHQREMKIIFRKNIHERGNSRTGDENHFQNKTSMKEGIHQREMKTIFRKNIHERGNSPT